MSDMTTPANEWREQFRNHFWLHRVPKNTKQMHDIEAFIQTLLEDTAVIKGERRRIIEQIREEERERIVGRIEKERDRTIQWATTEAENKQFREIRRVALDQAIDIVKVSNK